MLFHKLNILTGNLGFNAIHWAVPWLTFIRMDFLDMSERHAYYSMFEAAAMITCNMLLNLRQIGTAETSSQHTDARSTTTAWSRQSYICWHPEHPRQNRAKGIRGCR